MVEAETLSPDAYHAPTVARSIVVRMWLGFQEDDVESLQQNYSGNDGVKHSLRAKLIPLLNPPKTIDTDCLSSDADE